MPKAATKQTRAVDVRLSMRGDILAGRLKPGQRLMFPDLCERYSASVGVVREALTWLSSQGLVLFQARQGHMVTPLSREDLQGLAFARVAIEPGVLRASIANSDIAWEAGVVAANHVMVAAYREMNANRTDDGAPRDDLNDLWAQAHAAFHDMLFAGCDNRRLLAITRALAEEATLYRRWSDTLAKPRDVMSEHNALLEAVLARDSDAAAELLREHILRTADALIIYAED